MLFSDAIVDCIKIRNEDTEKLPVEKVKSVFSDPTCLTEPLRNHAYGVTYPVHPSLHPMHRRLLQSLGLPAHRS